MHPSDEQLRELSAYVANLDEQRKLKARLEALEQRLGDAEDAALVSLQGVGAVALPVEEGEWQLRADRDENGAFVDRRYEDKQWSTA